MCSGPCVPKLIWSSLYYKAIGSGPVHAQIALELAIGLLERDCPTWAGTCWSGARWCPQWEGRWRGGGGRRKKGRAEAPLLKSKDPHRPSPGRWGTRQTNMFKTRKEKGHRERKAKINRRGQGTYFKPSANRVWLCPLGKNTGEVWQREKQAEKKKDNDMEGETEKPEHPCETFDFRWLLACLNMLFAEVIFNTNDLVRIPQARIKSWCYPRDIVDAPGWLEASRNPSEIPGEMCVEGKEQARRAGWSKSRTKNNENILKMEDIRKEHVKNIVKHKGKGMRRWIKGAR